MHVHWPTDVSLLRDAVVCLLRKTVRVSRAHGMLVWRKAADWAMRLHRLFQGVAGHGAGIVVIVCADICVTAASW